MLRMGPHLCRQFLISLALSPPTSRKSCHFAPGALFHLHRYYREVVRNVKNRTLAFAMNAESVTPHWQRPSGAHKIRHPPTVNTHLPARCPALARSIKYVVRRNVVAKTLDLTRNKSSTGLPSTWTDKLVAASINGALRARNASTPKLPGLSAYVGCVNLQRY